jgi:hypothetical protein
MDVDHPSPLIHGLSEAMILGETSVASYSSTPLSELPTELWNRFISFLDQSDLASFSEVSKECCTIARASTTRIHIEEPTSPTIFRDMARIFPNLNHLRVDAPTNLSDLDMLALGHLTQLRTLMVYNMHCMRSSTALLRALWNLKNLTHLELDFGPEMPSRENFSIICTMVALVKLEKLTLINAPAEWNDMQSTITFCLKNLESLYISYQTAPDSLDFLAPLQNLRSLHLEMSGSQQEGLTYVLPSLPKLEHLVAGDLCFSSESIERLQSLQYLNFTPWGWKRKDLIAFTHLPLLTNLRLRVNYLPSAEFLARAFGRITTLTLVEFDIARCTSLYKLRNLRTLALDAPSRLGVRAKCRHLKVVAELLQTMTWITSFALTNVAHLSQDVRNAIVSKSSNIVAVELSGCDDCLQQFIDTVNQTEYPKLRQIIVHTFPETLVWTYGSDRFEPFSATTLLQDC